MSKEKVNPNHRMGKRTGYDIVVSENQYRIAPSYQQLFERSGNLRQGIYDMLRAVTRHATGDLEGVAKMERGIWKDLIDDLELKGEWSYDSITGIITRHPEPKDKLGRE